MCALNKHLSMDKSRNMFPCRGRVKQGRERVKQGAAWSPFLLIKSARMCFRQFQCPLFFDRARILQHVSSSAEPRWASYFREEPYPAL